MFVLFAVERRDWYPLNADVLGHPLSESVVLEFVGFGTQVDVFLYGYYLQRV